MIVNRRSDPQLLTFEPTNQGRGPNSVAHHKDLVDDWNHLANWAGCVI